MSEYQEWVENTAINLNNSAKARQRSRKIVQVNRLFVCVTDFFKRLINSTREFAQAMRQEAINVENTLKDSIRYVIGGTLLIDLFFRNWTEWRDSLQTQVRFRSFMLKHRVFQLNAKDKDMKIAEAAVNEIQVTFQGPIYNCSVYSKSYSTLWESTARHCKLL